MDSFGNPLRVNFDLVHDFQMAGDEGCPSDEYFTNQESGAAQSDYCPDCDCQYMAPEHGAVQYGDPSCECMPLNYEDVD